MAAAWLGLGFPLLFIVVGTALATNYRGAASRHVQAAHRPFQRRHREPHDLSRLVLLDRIIGGVFAVFGTLILILIVADLIVGPGRFVHYGR